jgi:tetratricopeptide (TPR) repeat protein
LDVLIGHLRNYEKGDKGDYEKVNFIIDCLQKDFDQGIHLSKEDEILYNMNLFLLSISSPSDHDNGLENAFKALTLIEEEPRLYEEKMRLYSNLIQYHTHAGLLEEGKQYIQKGRDIFCLSQSDAYNALFVYAVMMFHLEEGDIDKTISHIEEHQELLDRQELDPSLRFYSLSLLGEALIKKGKIEEAQKVLSTAEKLAREFYDGETVSFFGRLCVLKGYAKSLLGDHQQAQELIQRSIQIYEALYKAPDKHQNQAFAHFILGKNYYLERQLDAAKQELLYSEKIYQKVQKSQRTSDVSDLYKTLIQVGADLKNEELIREFLKKQVDTFGLRHPRTREIYAYLDEKGIVVVL